MLTFALRKKCAFVTAFFFSCDSSSSMSLYLAELAWKLRTTAPDPRGTLRLGLAKVRAASRSGGGGAEVEKTGVVAYR